MIIPMAKVRILGPRDRIEDTLSTLQDFGLLHLADASAVPGLSPPPRAPREARRERYLRRAIDDTHEALTSLDIAARGGTPPDAHFDLRRVVRPARRLARQARTLAQRRQALEEERRQLARYRDFLGSIRPVLERLASSKRLTTYAVVIPASARDTLQTLTDALRAEVGADFATASRELPGGDLAVLLVLPRTFAERIEDRLAEARVPEIPVPDEYAGRPLTDVVPAMLARLDGIPGELAAIERERRRLADANQRWLVRQLAALHGCIGTLEARRQCGVTARAFAVEGWLPYARIRDLREMVRRRVGDTAVVEELGREAWAVEDAPVVLSNPRLFRPFEAIVRMLPLPVYGTIDPTPFVAVFFPMFFGMIVGDIGYGIVLATIGVFVHHRSRPGSIARTIAEIAGPCAAFTIVFGALYGEFFGDLGHRWFGFRALWFDRGESVMAALAVAAGLGAVHVVLGIAVGAASSWRSHRRHAIGRALSGLMVVLVVVVLLAAFGFLPGRLYTPAVVALLVAFPLLVALEGFLAPLELLATLGNVLSYTRIMALGTASVMLAVVANRMVGAIGSAVVGFIFALLFHLVNFAIGLFSPSIHAMRLHFVEFFGKFYSPGGRRYEPFGHWRPTPGA
ncbi:MAG TPA: V-type ATPase 116kDa subunit family protein [Gemmatimonadaceae bacterium]